MTATVELIEPPRGICCTEVLPTRLSVEAAQQFCDELQILAHPIRMQILDILGHSAGQVCVCDLEAALPVKQPTVSHHLRLLREAGLIDCERQGLWADYFIRREALAALRVRIARQLESLALLASFYDPYIEDVQ
jgi:ArsR family transcriptional regulator, arsenate/arsenite/antimonite-responsive transcriptional repressor